MWLTKLTKGRTEKRNTEASSSKAENRGEGKTPTTRNRKLHPRGGANATFFCLPALATHAAFVRKQLLYINKRGNKKTIQLYTKPYTEPNTTASKTLHWGVQKPTQNPARNLMLKFEKPFPSGRGWGRLLKSPSLQGGVGVGFKKSNNFEPFFSDSTLTLLTYRNTFYLPILPIWRIVFLCLPQILLCLPLIFLCLPLILTGCASKTPDFKGKVTKKRGSRGSSHISIQI